jgi:hypothetical protein
MYSAPQARPKASWRRKADAVLRDRLHPRAERFGKAGGTLSTPLLHRNDDFILARQTSVA